MKRGILLIILIIILPITTAFCGDGIIDEDDSENCGNCPEDNPCFVEETCINDKCVSKLIPPLFIKNDPFATIIVPTEIAESLNTKFVQEKEFVSCLKGKYSDGIYQITKEIQPEVLDDSPFHIEHKGCPKLGTIATIHSHLDGNCNPSKVDLFSFGKKREPLMAIICGENNYGFYSKDNFENKMNYLIRDIPDGKSNYIIFFLPWIFSVILILILVIVIYEKHKIVSRKNKDLALNILEEFNKTERKVLNLLIEIGELPRKKIPSSLFMKLNQENLIEIKGNVIRLKKWFRNALEGI